jgi:Tol biopolymer transport system component
VDITTRRVPVVPINWRLLIVVAIAIVAILAAALFASGTRPRIPAPPFGPAANGLIAYEADAGDIYLGDPATGASRPIVVGPYIDFNPVFSNDGTRLFFRRTREAGYDFMVADADGSNARAVTSEPIQGVTGEDWSADGRYLVVATDYLLRKKLLIIDVERGSTRAIELGGLAAHDPVFRPPDGREIAFTVGEFSGAAIYVVDTDGEQPVKLADGGYPTYSPDGSRIAFGRSYQPAVERNEARVMDADGAHDHVVGDRPDIQYQGTATWSPDGTRLLMFRNSTTSGLVLAMASADGSSPGQEFRVGFTGGFGGLGWSPDGRYVVSVPAEESNMAMMVNLADGTIRAVPRWYTESWQRLAPGTDPAPLPTPSPRPG